MQVFIIVCTLFVAGMILCDLHEISDNNRRETIKERIRRKKNFFD